jgi:hypothetical protein
MYTNKWISGIFCPLYLKDRDSAHAKTPHTKDRKSREPKPKITDLSPVKEKEVDALTLKNKLGTRYNEK